MPDRTANTLVITEDKFGTTLRPISIPLSWHRYTGDAEGLYLCAGRSSGTGDRAGNPTEIMTDTAGASELVFGLFWLLGYQFSTPG